MIAESDSDDIFLVRGREAVRVAEARLLAQVLAVRAAETRAISIVGWSVIAALAGLTVIFGNYPSRYQLAAIPAVSALCCSAITACIILWPRGIDMPGMRPTQILDGRPDGQTEAALLYSIAEGYGIGIEFNSSRIRWSAKLLKWSIAELASAPVLAIVVALLCVVAGF
jgi:hypothetical protein